MAKREKTSTERKEERKFWLGVALCAVGSAILFTAMLLPPRGEIPDMALWASGELFTLAGALLGVDSYFDFKLRRFISNKGKDDNEEVEK